MPLSTSGARLKISSSPLFSFRRVQQTAAASPLYLLTCFTSLKQGAFIRGPAQS